MVEGVVEGATRIAVQADGRARGPGTRDRETAFYNPAMAVNRDLSVLLVEAFARQRGRQVDVADVLAGAGARSMRLAHEVDADIVVHANDADPKGAAAIRAAATSNGIGHERLRIVEGPARRILADRRFDVVDIDPFGSPMPFLDAALQATRHDGLLCLTATDTGALCGTYPKACRRRYGAEPLHAAAWRAEVGLRILIANAVRAAGRVDRAVTPVLGVARGHWMRIVVRVAESRAEADRAARLVGHVSEHGQTCQGVRADAGAGPAWWGPLHDAEVLQSMQAAAPDHAVSDDSRRLLDSLVAEAALPPYWVPLQRLPSRLGGDVPRRSAFLSALADAGFDAAVSHIDDHGIRTDAAPDDIVAAWRSVV